MKINTFLMALLGSVLCFSPLGAAVPDIPSPQVRSAIITKASGLLQPRKFKYELVKNDLTNPFAPNQAVVLKAEAHNLRPSSDHEFLVLLANQLNPTGVLMLGDDALLMFGEKKVKVGESIKIPFDNQFYDIELVDLSRTAFTVKFNTELITRPIKQAKAQ